MNHTSPTTTPAFHTDIDALIRWHGPASRELQLLQKQLESIVLLCLLFVKPRAPETAASLSLKFDVLLSLIKHIRQALQLRYQADLPEFSRCPLYFLPDLGEPTPELLHGVGQKRAQHLNDNLRSLSKGGPTGYLDKISVSAVRSFLFATVKDTISQVCVDMDRWPADDITAQVKEYCQRVEAAALSLSLCFQ